MRTTRATMPPPSIYDDKSPREDTPEVLRGRLLMARAFSRMLLEGYDALLHYGINFRDLPSYRDETLLDQAKEYPFEEGKRSYLHWIERVSNDIAAAIRRKFIKKV